ncbi:Ribonuclease 2-like protein [Drosera capensis]
MASSPSAMKSTAALIHLPIIGLLFLLILLAGTNAESNSKQREFDYFALALQWPGTVCRGTRHCCSYNACCRRSNDLNEFTIHGLWPDYNDGTWPACCSNSRFDIKEISTLHDALDHYWPSMSCSSPSTCHGRKGSFWAHESVLNEAGYVPSNSEKYPLGGIVSAIENAFHATPLLVCSKDAVEELHLCFYKNFEPRDCAHSSKSSCPDYVSLPAKTSWASGTGNIEQAIPTSSGVGAL